MILPAPTLREHGGFIVVRDDLLPGGTKRRVLARLFAQERPLEACYASPAYGYAQIALAYAARDLGIQATVFVAKRSALHPRTAEAKAAGARIVQVPHGYLSNVQAKARGYCEATGASLIPWGLDTPEHREALSAIARALPIAPREVWCVAGSGMLTRSLQAAWPAAKHFAVRIGANPAIGRAVVIAAPERYEAPAAAPPPFPSCSNYDAKAWRFMRERASAGALFWNVGA